MQVLGNDLTISFSSCSFYYESQCNFAILKLEAGQKAHLLSICIGYITRGRLRPSGM